MRGNGGIVWRRELYRSAPDGDRWSLVCEEPSGRVLVEHVPNAASGGGTSYVDVEQFMSGNRQAPERQALLSLVRGRSDT